MSNTDNTNLSTWERIQTGVRDTERCIGQKKYNMAMVKARQTLEYMVKCLCEKSGTPEGSLIDMIDTLYEDGVISKTTCEHFHKIRTIGNKAIHEDDNSAYNANQAHHLLSQEVYTFANDYKEKRKKTAASSRRQASPDTVARSRAERSSSRGSASSSAGRSSRSSSSGRRTSSVRSSSLSGNRRRPRTTRSSIDIETILKPLLLVAIIIVLIFIIKMIHPSPEDTADSAADQIVSTEAVAESETPAETPAETEAPVETEPAPVIYKTTDILNVRSTPSTENERIGVLNAGVEVEFVGDHDDRWAIIMFNGSEAYVVKEYLTAQ